MLCDWLVRFTSAWLCTFLCFAEWYLVSESCWADLNERLSLAHKACTDPGGTFLSRQNTLCLWNTFLLTCWLIVFSTCTFLQLPPTWRGVSSDNISETVKLSHGFRSSEVCLWREQKVVLQERPARLSDLILVRVKVRILRELFSTLGLYDSERGYNETVEDWQPDLTMVPWQRVEHSSHYLFTVCVSGRCLWSPNAAAPRLQSRRNNRDQGVIWIGKETGGYWSHTLPQSLTVSINVSMPMSVSSTVSTMWWNMLKLGLLWGERWRNPASWSAADSRKNKQTSQSPMGSRLRYSMWTWSEAVLT